MPLYDFRCAQCDHTFEANLSLEEKKMGIKPSCPQCDSQEVGQIFKSSSYVRRRTDDRVSSLGYG